jgi:hypothetical protein
MNKNFILGVGAQKSATGWLHQYISKSPYYNMGRMKEYHIWDALSISDCKKKFYLKNLISIFFRKNLTFSLSLDNFINNIIRFRMQSQQGFYEKYFFNLVKNHVKGTGDITPSYSGLSADMYQVIKERIEGYGFKLKIVFLMRDPFERCCSAARMEKRKNKLLNDTDSNVLRKLYSTSNFILRTDYKRNIQALESVFKIENIYYGIYEEMFVKKKVDELSSFLEIDSNYEFANTRTKQLHPKLENIDEDLKNEIINFYSDVYKFCFKRFPQTSFLWSKKF